MFADIPNCFQPTKGERLGLVGSLPTALKQRFFGLWSSQASKQDHESHIKTFYGKYRDNPDEVDLADIGSGYLHTMVSTTLQCLQDDYRHLVDVGCGNGSVSLLPSLATKHYTGVDLLITTLAKEPNHTFIESSISPDLKIDGDVHPRLFLFANILCYLDNLDSVFQFLNTNCMSEDILLVVEPTTSIFWETYFDGIKLNLRKSDEITKHAEFYNWRPMHRGHLCMYHHRGLHLAKLTNLLVFKRQ